MDRQTAAGIIQDTFENPFDKEKFRWFVKNLLNSIEDAPFVYKGNLIPDAYDRYVSTLERIGKYSDGDHKIDILVVKLRKRHLSSAAARCRGISSPGISTAAAAAT